MSRWSFIACWVVIVASWTLIAYQSGFINLGSWFGECGWFAPKMVEFHQGMMLCPGQTVHVKIRVPLSAPQHQDDGI